MVFKKNSKKAFGDAASTLILFIAVISVTTGIVIMFKNYVADTEHAFSTQHDLSTNKLETSLSVSNVYYNSTNQRLYVYVKNVGQTSLGIKNIQVFFDSSYVTSFNATYAYNLSKKMVTFKPQDTLVIYKKNPLAVGTHDVRVVTEYGTSVKESFNI